MRDLKNSKWMWAKAWMLLGIGLASCTLLLVELGSWRGAALLALGIWAFCRLYYFAFYVIEKYVDPKFRFSGLISALQYLLKNR